MALPGDAARATLERNCSMDRFFHLARRFIQHISHGTVTELAAAELAEAERVLRDLTNEQSDPPKLLKFICKEMGSDAAAFVGFLSVALRCSSPFADGEGQASSYASIRDVMLLLLLRGGVTKYPLWWASTCNTLLAPALRHTDALHCCSRILAEAAEQLKQSSAPALFPTNTAPPPAAASSNAPATHAHVAPGDSAHSGQQHTGTAQQQQSPGVCHRQEHPTPRQPTPDRLDRLLSCCVQSILHVTAGLHSCIELEGEASSSDSDDADADEGGCSASAGPARRAMASWCAELHSSWLLEHWAQVLALGTAAAAVAAEEGGAAASRDACRAQALLSRQLFDLCRVTNTTSLSFRDFVRRPCGCALAATHMAQLCAALDGGDAFGAARPPVLTLPAYDWDAREVAECCEPAAFAYDATAARLGRAASLRTAVAVLRSWLALLGEELRDGPCTSTAGARGAGLQADAVEGLQGGSAVAGERRGREDAGRDPSVAGARAGGQAGRVLDAVECQSKLPPFDRGATFHVCLRLAKGVLARWAKPLPGVCLDEHHGAAAPVQLPKVGAAVALRLALACARLALLPDVWGRQRVGRRSRERLRAWWEVCVEAVQHPEALRVASPHDQAYPGWTARRLPGDPCGTLPSADAAAALAAGLLPCAARQVERMAAASRGGLWCPPGIFPGVDSVWQDVLRFGSAGQVAGLVSALGRGLRAAVGRMQLTAMAAGGEGRGLLKAQVQEVTRLATVCTSELLVPLSSIASAGQVENSGPTAGEEAAGAGATADSAAVRAAGCGPIALRLSFVAGELLPAVSLGVRACAELARGPGQGQGAADGAGARAMLSPVDCSHMAHAAVECTVALMARLCLAAAEAQSGTGGAGAEATGAGAATSSSTGGPLGDGAGVEGAEAGPVAPWRQLLLWDIGLMELLGAAAAVHRMAAVAVAASGQLASAAGPGPVLPFLRRSLANALPLAAAAFPAEFRAAYDGCRAAAKGAEAPVCGAGEGAAAAPTGAAGGPGAGARLCIAQADVAVLMAAWASEGGQLQVLDRVCDGWHPSPEEAWTLACRCWWGEPAGPEQEAALRLLLPPAEACAAMAATPPAAAAEAAASPPGVMGSALVG